MEAGKGGNKGQKEKQRRRSRIKEAINQRCAEKKEKQRRRSRIKGKKTTKCGHPYKDTLRNPMVFLAINHLRKERVLPP